MEVVALSTPNYPNRNALREANDIYLDYMRPFIIDHLKKVPGEKVEDLIADGLTDEQENEFWQILGQNDDDIESAIDFNYFPLIVQRNWSIIRSYRECGFAQWFAGDMSVQNRLWLIKEGRNACEHRGTKDLDSELVRTLLFLVAEVLGKINRPDEQDKVEAIRDELFADDTSERLAEAEQRLKVVETENAEYRKHIEKTEECLAAAEAEKRAYQKDNATLLKQAQAKENCLTELSERLKLAKTETEAERRTFEERLDTLSNQLAAAQAEKREIVERLTAMQDLFTTATLEKPKTQAIFPEFDTYASVRLLDRRGTEDKRNYLLELLKRKRPAIIYVQNEDEVNRLFELVGSKKGCLIGKHDEQTPHAEETQILEKLESGKLIAVVSNAIFSRLTSLHCIEHFVFCHLVPDLNAFFKRCGQAFTSAKNSYLHLIYNRQQDVKRVKQWLAHKHPDRKMLGHIYRNSIEKTNGSFINQEDIYNRLNMASPGIETALAIFEELQLIEKNEHGITFLPGVGKKLEESKIYNSGEKLKHEIEKVCTFQLDQPIEKIWDAISPN